MSAYDRYFSGDLQNYSLSEEDLKKFRRSTDELNKNIKF